MAQTIVSDSTVDDRAAGTTLNSTSLRRPPATASPSRSKPTSMTDFTARFSARGMGVKNSS